MQDTTNPAVQGSADPNGASGSGGVGELIGEVGALLIAAVLAGLLVLVRRWLRLRSRQQLPGLPKEKVLPLSHHGTLHDPKYLGRILEADKPPSSP